MISSFRSRAGARNAVLGAALAYFACHGTAGAAEVDAPAGVLVGSQADGMTLYRGIPYAEAPTGARRWAAPVPKARFAEPFQASSDGNECPQFAVFWRPGKPASGSEDCLSLTVYVPDGGQASRPVMVGFHGGGSRNGAKSDWDPREMAREGNIVVTANYRLGALGFLALSDLNAESPDNKSSGNFGDLDRIQVLRWVRENIAAFGGDPSRVTIAGQSAGARGVCYLLASPEAKGLFAGAVMESGSSCPSVPNAEAAKNGEAFAEAVGCKGTADRLACLRAKSPAEILAMQESTKLALPLVHGGASLPVTPVEAFASGAFNRVPVIVGNTRNETRVFTYEANDLQKQPVTHEQYEAGIRKTYGEKADAVLAAYAEEAENSPGMALSDVETDQRYLCGTARVMDALAKWTPTHAYEFADTSAPIRAYATVPPSFDLGVPHSSELPYLWGEQTVPNGLTADQRKLAKTMRGYWMRLSGPEAFAGEAGAAWPAYEPENRRRIVFHPGGKTEIVQQDAYLGNRHCELFAR